MAAEQPFTTTSPVLASYSFIELLTNRGYADFYPLYWSKFDVSNIETPTMSTAVRRTTQLATSGKHGASFDFQTGAQDETRIIDGKVYIEYAMAINRVYAGTSWGQWDFELLMVDPDSNETSLGTEVGEQIGGTGTGYEQFTESLVSFNVSKTPLRAGWTLILRCTVVAREAGSGDDLKIYNDPEDNTVDGISPVLKLSVPFRRAE